MNSDEPIARIQIDEKKTIQRFSALIHYVCWFALFVCIVSVLFLISAIVIETTLDTEKKTFLISVTGVVFTGVLLLLFVGRKDVFTLLLSCLFAIGVAFFGIGVSLHLA